MEFKVGDRVRLRGGGAKGTIFYSNETCSNVRWDVTESETMPSTIQDSECLKKLKPKAKPREWWGLVSRTYGEAGSFCKSEGALKALCGDGIPPSCEVVHVREVRQKLA